MSKVALLAFVAFLAPVARAVCAPGDLAIGIISNPLARPTLTATLWNSDCEVLDSRTGQADVCGSYDNGATVICNAGSETAASAQLGNGLDFGECVQDNDNETCAASEGEGFILWCCAPAP